jgi:hypothetical protein
VAQQAGDLCAPGLEAPLQVAVVDKSQPAGFERVQRRGQRQLDVLALLYSPAIDADGCDSDEGDGGVLAHVQPQVMLVDLATADG